MKRHLTLSTTTNQQVDDPSRDVASNRVRVLVAEARDQPQLTLVRTRPWTHTLILKGNLDQHSAPDLEDEIECLRQEGVTALTLDLRQLDAIDSSGAELIASQGTSFKQRGRGFAALVGSPVIHQALADAGGMDLFSAPSSFPAASEVSTTMMKDLGLHG